MLQPYKRDPELGLEIHRHLLEQKVETPGLSHASVSEFGWLGNKHSQASIEESFASIMKQLSLDSNNDSLAQTPHRVAKMYVNELFYGLDYANFPKCTTTSNKTIGYDDHMLVCRDIAFRSTCEHHFVMIDGSVTVGYIPKKRVIGLSKFNRVVDFFARRPQVQERATVQIFHALSYILDTVDLAVFIKSDHYCVKHRGIQDQNSDTITSKLGGEFYRDGKTRNEFQALVTKD